MCNQDGAACLRCEAIWSTSELENGICDECHDTETTEHIRAKIFVGMKLSTPSWHGPVFHRRKIVAINGDAVTIQNIRAHDDGGRTIRETSVVGIRDLLFAIEPDTRPGFVFCVMRDQVDTEFLHSVWKSRTSAIIAAVRENSDFRSRVDRVRIEG
jgi:hypothetical protein